MRAGSRSLGYAVYDSSGDYLGDTTSPTLIDTSLSGDTVYDSEGNMLSVSQLIAAASAPAASAASAPGAATIPTPPATGAASGSSDWLTSLVSAAKSILPAATTAYTTAQVQQINLQRAAQGLPPLTPAQLAPTAVVGLSSQTSSLVTMVAIGLGGVFLLTRARGRKR